MNTFTLIMLYAQSFCLGQILGINQKTVQTDRLNEQILSKSSTCFHDQSNDPLVHSLLASDETFPLDG